MTFKHTSGNQIYELLVAGFTKHRATGGTLKYAEGISHICIGRQMGHTTAILQLFKENAENSFLITPVMNKQVRMEIPDEYWGHVYGPDFIRYLKPEDERKKLKYVMIDFCSVPDKVRCAVLEDVRNTFKNVEYIFCAQ